MVHVSKALVNSRCLQPAGPAGRSNEHRSGQAALNVEAAGRGQCAPHRRTLKPMRPARVSGLTASTAPRRSSTCGWELGGGRRGVLRADLRNCRAESQAEPAQWPAVPPLTLPRQQGNSGERRTSNNAVSGRGIFCKEIFTSLPPRGSPAPGPWSLGLTRKCTLTKEHALPRVSADTATTSQLSSSNSGIRCCRAGK